MKLTTYSYWIDSPSDTNVYTFATAEARAAVLRSHLKQIFENEDLGEVDEDADEIEQEDVIEEALDDAGWTYGLDECVMELPVLTEVAGHLRNIVNHVEWTRMYPSAHSLTEVATTHATEALNKLNSIKS